MLIAVDYSASTKMRVLLSTVLLFSEIWGLEFGAPPRVETAPVLLDSFIPASMQIIAYITELMKFDLRPPTGGPTTLRPISTYPTRPHKPAIFAPDSPLGAEAYFAKGLSYEEYVERLRKPSGLNYFDRYKVEGRGLPEEVPQDLELYVGRSAVEALRLANTLEEGEENEDERLKQFERHFEDGGLLRQKQKPPTRAYVSLLSLYDLLNKEAKKLGLNKYTGYTESILTELSETSSGTSADQLRIVLTKITERKDTSNAAILKRITELTIDLQNTASYISAALRYIPPLKFTP